MSLYHTVYIVVGAELKFTRVIKAGPSKLVTRYNETTGQPYMKTIESNVAEFRDWNGKVYTESEYCTFVNDIECAFDEQTLFVMQVHPTCNYVVGVNIDEVGEGKCRPIQDYVKDYGHIVQSIFDKLGINAPIQTVVYHDYS